MADLPAVLRLERQSYPRPWPASFFRHLIRGHAFGYIYELDDAVIGYGVMRCSRKRAHIMNINIAPRFRRQGLGRRMLIQMMNTAHRCKAMISWLEVHSENRGAIALYRNLGFSIQYRRKGYYRCSPQRQRDALIMTCKLGRYAADKQGLS